MCGKRQTEGECSMQVSILGLAFECKLIPKGNRKYLIPIAKKTLSALAPEEEYEIEMELLETLSSINHDSPFPRNIPYGKLTVLKQSQCKPDSAVIAALQCLPV